jgi:tRNA C32,U32 (ribose-2'-O)-methylase TrmJ
MFNKTGLTQQEVKTLHGVVTALTEKKEQKQKMTPLLFILALVIRG